MSENDVIPDDVRKTVEDLATMLLGDMPSIAHRHVGFIVLKKAITKTIFEDRQREQWQPIESAPEDWSDVLLFDPEYQNDHHKVFEGYYDSDLASWMNANGQEVRPTHWMPLPVAPKGGAA